MRTSLLVAALTGGLLAGSVVGVAAQDEADALQLVTEEVEPGVERIISDGVGHDLDELHPTDRYNMDAIAIAADGTIWLTSSPHNSADPGHLWVLGRPGSYRSITLSGLITLADGTLLGLTDHGSGDPDLLDLVRFDGERWVPDEGPRLRATADGGFLLFLDRLDLVELSGGQITVVPVLDTFWNGWSWAELYEHGRTGLTAGDHECWIGEGIDPDEALSGVSCARRGAYALGEARVYLAGTYINRLAAAPDGSVWAVGDYDDGPGGLYRITLPEPDAE